MPSTVDAPRQPAPNPVAERGLLSRVIAIDLARFLAIAGMMAAHLLIDGAPAWVSGITAGIPSTLFAVIGGVSVILSTRSLSTAGHHLSAALSLIARGIVVAALGLLLGFAPTSVIVVLVYFGVSLMLASALLRLSVRTLAVVATALAVAGPFSIVAARTALDLNTVGELSLADPFAFAHSVLFTGSYPVITWLVYVVVGMIVGRLLIAAFEQNRVRGFATRTGVVGAALALTASVTDLLSRDLLVSQLDRRGLDSTTAQGSIADGGFGGPLGEGWTVVLNASPHTGTVGDIARTGGIALVVIAVLLIATAGIGSVTPVLLRPFVRAGAAPLTLYTLHVLATSVTLLAALLTGMTELPWWLSGPGILAIHLAVALLLGVILALVNRRGPLEALTSVIARQAGRLGRRRPAR